MTINEGSLCHWCGKQYESGEYTPACSEDHLRILRGGIQIEGRMYVPFTETESDETKPRLKRGLQGFEHKGDVSMIDNLKAEADEMIQRESKIKLWAKFINHILAAQAALFELITGEKPPKTKEILAIISGH